MRERQQAHLHLEQPERLVVEYPCRIRSEANLRGHWAKHDDRRKAHREQAKVQLMAMRWPKGPAWKTVVVRVTRIAPSFIKDEHDNLKRGFKATVDGIADWFGLDDSDPRITWAYRQEKAPPKRQAPAPTDRYRVRIELVFDGCGTCEAEGVLRQGAKEVLCPFCKGKGIAA